MTYIIQYFNKKINLQSKLYSSVSSMYNKFKHKNRRNYIVRIYNNTN